MGRFINDTTGVLVSVDDSKDERFAAGWTREGDAPKAKKADKPARSETPDDTWTNAELDAYAVEKGIDMGGASNKATRLAAIAAGKSLAPAGE
jgi:hypothetical protein